MRINFIESRCVGVRASIVPFSIDRQVEGVAEVLCVGPNNPFLLTLFKEFDGNALESGSDVLDFNDGCVVAHGSILWLETVAPLLRNSTINKRIDKSIEIESLVSAVCLFFGEKVDIAKVGPRNVD